jgi:glyoxylase-like metal-dependent hydrolase (beta-lactamase superfamily II)
MTLNFPVQWIHGAADCRQTTEPLLQTHEAAPATFVFRQSKCSSFEAPFMYLLIGTSHSLLLDTGAPIESGELPMRETVDRILSQQLGGSRNLLIVAHSHAHGDHGAWDRQFLQRQDTVIVKRQLADIQARFRIAAWPTATGTLDLGGRTLTVLPMPGHEDQHLAFHDSETGVLLSGDSLYPGLLVVNDWRAYRDSARRLASFARTHEVSFALGAHVEMSRSGQLFPIGTTFQPDEHPLQLLREDLDAWTKACNDLGDTPPAGEHRFDHFVIDIRG